MTTDGADQPQPARRSAWRDYLEQGVLVVVSLSSIVIAVLDFTGFLEETFLSGRIPSMALVVNGLVAGYLVIERRNALERLQEATREVNGTVQQLATRLGPLESSAARIRMLFEGLDGDRFSELRLVYGLRHYNASVGRSQIRGGAEQVFDMWADALREAKSFLAFNYVSSDEVWGTKGWAFNMAHALQLSRLHLGCTIKRVFIVDTPAECEILRALMNKQSSAGIEVKWILKSEFATNSLLLKYLQEIGTWDFVAIDTDLLFCVDIDESRHMTGCWLARNRELHQKAVHVFGEVFQLGHSPKKSLST